MNPSITQQLQSMKRCMEETILPEIPQEATFAREQATFITATLNWLILTHEHQYRYEVIENLEYRNVLSKLLDIDFVECIDNALEVMIRDALLQPGPSSDEAALPLRLVVEQTRHVKHLVAKLFTVLCEKSETHGQSARTLMGQVAISQGRRERAFFEGTGFTTSEEDLGSVLGERATSPA